MTANLRLLCVFAHPDDESLANGGMLARYAAEGVETALVVATRGERGWLGEAAAYPGPEAYGAEREGEVRAAARVLGLREVTFLDYRDGELDRADPTEATAKIAAHIRRVRPDVVVTFAPDGAYGHPDHIAICQFTTAALVRAADPAPLPAGDFSPHRVAKLYYMVATQPLFDAYQAVFGELVMRVDGVERRGVAWPAWAVTTRIDTRAYRQTAWAAIRCHASQLAVYHQLGEVSATVQAELWDAQTYYRAMSLVNGGRDMEEDMFEGLR
jgi:LmbE family N-acetylglucosaminyl deacetylase